MSGGVGDCPCTRQNLVVVAMLRKYGIEACLLQREAPLATVLATLPDWEQVHVDKLSTLFVHRTSQSKRRTEMGGGLG